MLKETYNPAKVIRETVGKPPRRCTYAEVVKGDALKKGKELKVQAKEYGIGWLFSSLVVKLKNQVSFRDFKEDLQNRGFQNIEVKEGWGRAAFLECIDTMVQMVSRGISYPIRVVEGIRQSQESHSDEVVTGSKSWGNVGGHERVDQSSVSRQLGHQEEDADKDARHDDLDIQDEVANNQWVDVEEKGLKLGGNCNSSTASIVKETASGLENQIVDAIPPGSKTSMQSKLLQRQVMGNCGVVENCGPVGLMRSLSDNGIVRPNINLEVVLSAVHYEELCTDVELGMERQKVVDPDPGDLVPTCIPVAEVHSNGLLEANDVPGFDHPIHYRPNQGKKVVVGPYISGPKTAATRKNGYGALVGDKGQKVDQASTSKGKGSRLRRKKKLRGTT
ncbi:hypothetical protein LOK49_LG04G02403 [Camellia lanceoleosa]|uniref:Uncharacterized protein n=1 Tax=Camellia lanceoleosa TaxID=1840588 RepID=A0ACC0HZX8_9ERIC|nr:hypothetical protein LOK49_LG04G02403 [Camellia lanceoleosa]